MTFPEGKGRQLVDERAGGRCELCLAIKPLTFSHRLSRAHGGTWAPSNGVRLCGSGTTGCHGWVEANPMWAVAGGWRVLSMQQPEDVPVWLNLPWPGWYCLDDQGCYLGHETERGQPEHLPPHVGPFE